jgi:hypothetical protein
MNEGIVRPTPVGYDETVMYKDLKVTATYDSTSHQAKLETYFANRFLLEINVEDVSDPNILYGPLDKVNLVALRALVQPSKINNEK